MGCRGLINMAHRRNMWLSVLYSVINVLVPYIRRNFLAGRPPNSVTKFLYFLESVSFSLLLQIVISQTNGILSLKQSFLETVDKHTVMLLQRQCQFAGTICGSCTIPRLFTSSLSNEMSPQGTFCLIAISWHFSGPSEILDNIHWQLVAPFRAAGRSEDRLASQVHLLVPAIRLSVLRYTSEWLHAGITRHAICCS